MILSVEEADSRYQEAQKAKAENTVLEHWYWGLREMLREQANSDGPIAQQWILYDSDATQWFAKEKAKAGASIPKDFDDYVKLFIEFVNHLIGDQLQELGLEAKSFEIYGGMDSAMRIYFLKPGEELRLN